MTVEPGRLEASGSAIPEESLEAARAADSKQANSTVVMAMGDLLGVADAFVVTSGQSTRQVKTIVEEVERWVKRIGGRAPIRVEGLRDLTWVLMDYGDFVVHVFLEETRQVYDLERLWGNAQRVEWQICFTGEPAG
ncbi:MAG: ribosome silencing factor [Acidimicrobiales bacterium]